MEDVVSPIALRLNLSLVGEPIPSSQNLHPMLAEGSEDLVTAYVSTSDRAPRVRDAHSPMCLRNSGATTQFPRPTWPGPYTCHHWLSTLSPCKVWFPFCGPFLTFLIPASVPLSTSQLLLANMSSLHFKGLFCSSKLQPFLPFI